jgi:hypothetical protein
MKGLLKSPLHGVVSSRIMIIGFEGRTSGKHYSTPVSYFQEQDEVYCFTHSPWWRNLIGGAPVELQLRGEKRKGIAHPETEDYELMAKKLGQMLRAVPNDAPFYEVSMDEDGEPDPQDLRRAAEDAVMIRIPLET